MPSARLAGRATSATRRGRVAALAVVLLTALRRVPDWPSPRRRALPDGVDGRARAAAVGRRRAPGAGRGAQRHRRADRDRRRRASTDPRFDGRRDARARPGQPIVPAGRHRRHPHPAARDGVRRDRDGDVDRRSSTSRSATAPATRDGAARRPARRSSRRCTSGSAARRRSAEAAAVTIASFTPSPAGVPGRPRARDRADRRGRGARSSTIQTTNLLTFARAGAPSARFPIDVAVAAGRHRRRRPCTCRSCRCAATRTPCRRTSAARSSTSTSSSTASRVEIELAASEDMRGRILTWVADWCGFGSAADRVATTRRSARSCEHELASARASSRARSRALAARASRDSARLDLAIGQRRSRAPPPGVIRDRHCIGAYAPRWAAHGALRRLAVRPGDPRTSAAEPVDPAIASVA